MTRSEDEYAPVAMSSARSLTRRRTSFSSARFSARDAAVMGSAAAAVAGFVGFARSPPSSRAVAVAVAVRRSSSPPGFASPPPPRASARSSSNSRALWNRAFSPDSLSMDHDPGEGSLGFAPATTSPSARDAEDGRVSRSRSCDAFARARRDRSWSSAALFFSPSPGRALAGLREGSRLREAGLRAGLREGSRLLEGLRVATPAGTKGTAPGSRGALWPSRLLRCEFAFGSSPKAASASSAATLSRNSRRNGSASS